VLTLSASSAFAAGPFVSDYDWSGFWVGGFAATAWGKTDIHNGIGLSPSDPDMKGGLGLLWH
jgi:hypothetical protein